VNPLQIDHASRALAKAIDAEIRADAEREMKKRMQSMAPAHRAKLHRLLSYIEFLGDVGQAMAKSRVTKKLLEKWMKTPGVSWHINTAFNKAQASLHCGRTASDILWRAKIEPELDKDAEEFKATGRRNRWLRVIAKMASRDLKAYRWHIVQAANNGDRHFFIDLGRILSGDASSEFYDQLDADIAELFVKNPAMSTGKALIELMKRGHSDVKEDKLRQRKSRLGLTKSIAANRDKSSSPTVTTDSANRRKVDAYDNSSTTNSGKSGRRTRKREPAD
jgi:hypothetical protein